MRETGDKPIDFARDGPGAIGVEAKPKLDGKGGFQSLRRRVLGGGR
jgi:hypothetical protein